MAQANTELLAPLVKETLNSVFAGRVNTPLDATAFSKLLTESIPALGRPAQEALQHFDKEPSMYERQLAYKKLAEAKSELLGLNLANQEMKQCPFRPTLDTRRGLLRRVHRKV